MTSILRRNANKAAHERALTGDLKMSAAGNDHLGWLLCDGRSLSTTAYNLLFQVVGYSFGGSGDSFHLPNPAGRVILPIGTVTDGHAHTLTVEMGDVNGEISHQLSIGEMPSHNHTSGVALPGVNTTADGTTSSYTHNHGGNTGATGSAPESETVVGTVTAVHSDAVVAGSGTHTHSIASDTHTHTIASNGGNLYHNNMQPYLGYGNAFIYCGIPSIGKSPFDLSASPVLI